MTQGALKKIESRILKGGDFEVERGHIPVATGALGSRLAHGRGLLRSQGS